MGLLALLAIVLGAVFLVQFARADRPPKRQWRKPPPEGPLGPRPTGDLPDTRTALVVGVVAWWLLRSLAASFVAGTEAKRLGGASLDMILSTSINLAVALALLRVATSGARRSGLPPLGQLTAGLRGGCAAFATSFAIGLVIQGAYLLLDRPTPSQEIVEIAKRAQGFELLIFVVGAVVVAPTAEEILFRGILLPAAATASGVRVALVVQAAAFGAVHVINAPDTWPLAVPLAAVGWLSGWLYLRTGSLAVSIVLHTTFNALNFAGLRSGDAV